MGATEDQPARSENHPFSARPDGSGSLAHAKEGGEEAEESQQAGQDSEGGGSVVVHLGEQQRQAAEQDQGPGDDAKDEGERRLPAMGVDLFGPGLAEIQGTFNARQAHGPI